MSKGRYVYPWKPDNRSFVKKLKTWNVNTEIFLMIFMQRIQLSNGYGNKH